MAKHDTNSKRNKRQKAKRNYSRAREEAQLRGVLPTVPEGAVRDERVDAATQEEQKIPSLDRLALAKGWAVPERCKPMLVDSLIDNVASEEASPIEKVMSFNALVKADQLQWERDNPELAGKTKGGVVQQNLALTKDELADALARAGAQRRMSSGGIGNGSLPASSPPLPSPGSGGDGATSSEASADRPG